MKWEERQLQDIEIDLNYILKDSHSIQENIEGLMSSAIISDSIQFRWILENVKSLESGIFTTSSGMPYDFVRCDITEAMGDNERSKS